MKKLFCSLLPVFFACIVANGQSAESPKIDMARATITIDSLDYD